MVTHAPPGAVFRAIADPTRRQILGLLRGGQLTVGEIAANFPFSRPAISKHLRTLRSAGLVRTQQRGTTRFCELSPAPLLHISEWLKDYERLWKRELHNLKRYVEENP